MNLNPILFQHRALCGTVLALALLAGCAAPPISSPAAQSAWAARQPVLAKLSHWRTVGRIGVVNEQDGWHANFQWDQQGPAYRIDLIGPLGQGRVVVQGDAEQVSIQTQDGQNWTASDADALLEQSLGVRLPVKGLRYWVRGLPEPGAAPVIETDAEGRLTRLEQNGWIIDYSAYTPTRRIELPARMVARRSDLCVKLVIEQWNL
jgi:outer membrane lipoprotein LolB